MTDSRWVVGVAPSKFISEIQPVDVVVSPYANSIGKRIFDIVGATILLILASPLMLVIAILIRVTSPGKILFRQERYTRGRQPFIILKFRTMTEDDDREVFLCESIHHQHVTWLGRYLRALHADELPQLWNILRGDMSLVGERPYPEEVEAILRAEIGDRVDDRYGAKAGLTGLPKLRRPHLRSADSLVDDHEQDMVWLNTCSFWLDLKIIIGTPIVMIKRHRADHRRPSATSPPPA